MKVLSLFDGIACGRVALERAGVKVDRYVAYEIDRNAIKIAQSNYPDIEEHGDVTKGDFRQFAGFDLVIGGSPCQCWSIAKSGHGRETDADGIGWALFSQFVRAWKESGARYFLYENNASMSKSIRDEITKTFGVEPIEINSELVSAQTRKRLYWTNIPGASVPADRGIKLQSILETVLSTVTRPSASCAATPAASVPRNTSAAATSASPADSWCSPRIPLRSRKFSSRSRTTSSPQPTSKA